MFVFPQASYPYTARGGKCLFKKEDIGATCTGFVNIKKGSEVDLLNAVATIGPISVAIDAGHQSFQVFKEEKQRIEILCTVSQSSFIYL